MKWLVGSALLLVACAPRVRDTSPPRTQNPPRTQQDSGTVVKADSGTQTMPDAGMMPPVDAGMMPPPDSGMPPGPSGLPVLGGFTHSIDNVTLTMIGQRADGLDAPSDIEIDPSTGQLYVTNKGDNSMWIVTNPGEPGQSTERAWSLGSSHFHVSPSALAFGLPGELATIHDVIGPTQPGDPIDFMGPTLFTTDPQYYDAGHGGHIDMLHNSPYGMGIAWAGARVYWVFDGYHSSLSRYDFNDDHGPGGAYHGDGVLARYVEGEVSRAPGVPSHMVFDDSTDLLYVADTGNNRIAVLDTTTGSQGGFIGPNYDGGDQYEVVGASLTTLVDGDTLGITAPSGLEMHGEHLFVTDYASGTILALTKQGELVDWLITGMRGNSLMGIALDSDGALYIVDSVDSNVIKIEPKP